jgi:DNA-binding response OmpR family regulator
MPTILVVDDSPSMVAFLEQVLQEAGHFVFIAASGKEAMQIIERESLDLVITDIYMPPPDGLELLLSARALNLKVPFIAMSSRHSPQCMFAAAREFGARITLHKPFLRERLIEAVDATIVLERKSAGSRLAQAMKPDQQL